MLPLQRMDERHSMTACSTCDTFTVRLINSCVWPLIKWKTAAMHHSVGRLGIWNIYERKHMKEWMDTGEWKHKWNRPNWHPAQEMRWCIECIIQCERCNYVSLHVFADAIMLKKVFLKSDMKKTNHDYAIAFTRTDWLKYNVYTYLMACLLFSWCGTELLQWRHPACSPSCDEHVSISICVQHQCIKENVLANGWVILPRIAAVSISMKSRVLKNVHLFTLYFHCHK